MPAKDALARAPKKPQSLVRFWSQENIQTRNVANRLNELSAAGNQIFSVNPSHQVGGSYEVIYYIEKVAEPNAD